MPIDRVDTQAVLRVLDPLWTAKPETGRRGRARILDAAAVEGLRKGDNPARLGGHIELLLSKSKKLTRGHQKAVAREELPEFMAWLQRQTSISAHALELLILTAARTGEVQLARRSEFDLEARVCTVPAERMKTGREHRVSLTDRAIAILKSVFRLFHDREAFVFPGGSNGHISNMAMLMCVNGTQI